MEVVYYSSKSENTKRFVDRLLVPALRIPKSSSDIIYATEPFVLICPTYSDNAGNGSVAPQVIRFLMNPDNRSLLRGVIGAGNRNFGKHYAYAADVISAKCNVPILHKFELLGLDSDVEIVRELLRNK